jgi:predicted MFS family arabinose efflux permease
LRVSGVKIFLVFLAAYVFSQFYRAFLAVVAVDLGRDLGFGPAELGNISAIWFITFALAQFPVGYALDHVGPRRTVAGFMVAAAIGAALFAGAHSYGTAMLAMALIGIGCSPILMGALYVFGRTADMPRFTLLASALIGLGNIGNLASATPLAIAVSLYGWRAAMAGIAVLTALAVLLAFVAITDPTPIRHEAEQRKRSALADLLEIVRPRALWPIFVMSAISYAVLACERGLWIGPFLNDVFAFDAVARGNAAFAMGLAMTIGAICLAPVAKMIGSERQTVLICGVITGLCFVALGLLPRDLAPEIASALAVLLLTLIGGIGMSYALLMAHGRRFYPPRLLGRGVTFQNFLFIGGASVMQSLSGRFITVSEHAGVSPATSYGRLHIAFGLVLIAATAIYALSRDDRQQPA